VKYPYRAVEKFWRNFYALRSEQKESVRRAWQIFKRDPFHPVAKKKLALLKQKL
jgi:hypothetical protein